MKTNMVFWQITIEEKIDADDYFSTKEFITEESARKAYKEVIKDAEEKYKDMWDGDYMEIEEEENSWYCKVNCDDYQTFIKIEKKKFEN